jgi:hypothetical protein
MNFFTLTLWVNEEFFVNLLQSVYISVHPWFIFLFKVMASSDAKTLLDVYGIPSARAVDTTTATS